MSQRVHDLERQMANAIRPATVAEIDYPNARVRLTIGENTTAWVPWVTGKSGKTGAWNPPEIGEQGLLMSSGGDFSAGYFMPGIYKKGEAPADSGDVSRTVYADGAVVEYDQASHAMKTTIPDGGKITATVGGASFETTQDEVTLKVGGVTLTIGSGGLTLTGGDIMADGISLKTHLHGGVETGGGNTAPPQ